ncbi:SDR family oxidoreductase [Streptomyces sp. NPDC020681]|uniref:SDR family oxidoreductase n=1 Tax=Streptomyces sp. NPDC020681 TaxID=3365083 RepID=UPI00379E0A50
MSTLTQNYPLSGRVAVITGASSGIGKAAAKRLAGLGASVAVLARRADRLSDLVTEIEKDGGTALAIEVDVTDTGAVRGAADHVATELGGADLVVNNAGIMLTGPIGELRTDEWQHLIDVNISGVMNTIGAFTQQLISAAAAGRTADLVNVSSHSARIVFPTFAAYAGTKAFVSHMSLNLRVELGQLGVRVSAIEPGLVSTELFDHVTDQGMRDALASATDMMLKAEDIAESIAFTVSLPKRVSMQQVTIVPTNQPS